VSLLRCPVTRQPLIHREGQLTTQDGAHSYPVVDGVPVLLAQEKTSGIFTADRLAAGSLLP
jgi:uncharacterized protein YbaR (Trm112 family)